MNVLNYINGHFKDSKDLHPVYDKYNEELLAEIPIADYADIEQAIQGNMKAFDVMKNYSAGIRASFLEKIYDLLARQKDKFAYLIAREAGKPISYAHSEVSRGLDNIKTGARETYTFAGEKISMDYLNGQGKTAYTIYRPTGPVLAITPFNFPLNLALHKIIPAIAVGASITVKIPPQASLTMLAFAEIIHKVGLPAGAVNILFTTNELSQKMVEDDRWKILSFTGSDKVGWKLKKISGKKKVLLEMGGNAAAIVDSTADVKRAARKLVYGSFLNAGQICISTQRIFVDKKVFDEFIHYFLEETKKVKSGDMNDEEVINSSMISSGDVQRIDSWIKEAVQMGAKVLTGGKILDNKANIYAPTVLTNTDNRMKVFTEEAFAPVVLIEPYENFQDAIHRVNDSRYGLQAGLFSNHLPSILKAQEELEVGGIIVNEVPGFRIDSMPYGGIKDSGMGREGAKYVMREYTEPKLIVLG
jgi:glyceraldehyde-3-phosphate dehydrogenase (NADP+)